MAVVTSPHVALKYIARFRCTAGDCEDTCCAGWKVPVDRAHYESLRRLHETSAEARALFDRNVVRAKRGGGDDKYASLTLDDGGRCGLLDADRLCSIHRAHGQDALPDACAHFPRVFVRVGERLEMSGTLACPEAARLCLLSPDAVDPVGLDPSATPRVVVRREVDRAAIEGGFEDVRAFLVEMLGDRGHPVSSRLFFLVWFAHRARELLRDGVRRGPPGALEAEMARLRAPGMLEAVDEQYRALQVDGRLALEVVQALLVWRVAAGATRFARLCARVWDGYRGHGVAIDGGNGSGESLRIDAPALVAAHRARRDAWMARWSDRIEVALENWATNEVLARPHLDCRTLMDCVRRLVVPVAMFRFLLFGHPLLGEREAAGGPTGGADEQVAVDRALVEVVSLSCKYLLHDEAGTRRFDDLLAERGFTTRAHLVALLAL